MSCKDDDKTFCMRQVGPDDDENFFGIPFEYSENWYACFLCKELGLGRKYAFEVPVGIPEGPRLKLKRRILCIN